MSPEFARVANLKTFELDNPIPLQLGCVGSRSVINFGVDTRMSLGNRSEDVYFDIANIDHYDVIIGVPLLDKWGMSLDFSDHTVKFGDQVIHSLKVNEWEHRSKANGRRVQRNKWAPTTKPE